MTEKKPVGVILLAFGGPDQPEAIEPFLTNLMGGRKPAPALVAKVRARYEQIGGSSPLLDITRAQAAKLEEQLHNLGLSCPVYVGMRYWHPYIHETLEQMASEGVADVVALSLSPHYSRVTTGAYLKEVEAATERVGKELQVIFAQNWYDHPLFIEALAEKVQEGFAGFPAQQQQDIEVVFSAHSLPVDYITQGDPYVGQLKTTVFALVKRLGLTNWHLAYQSKGGGKGEWLTPLVEDVLDRLAEAGKRNVLLVPVGFVCDHVETLYDIDIEIREHAGSLQLNFKRCRALNTTPKFIEALADVVRKTLDKKLQ